MLKILLIDLGDVRRELNEPLGIECISSRVIREKKVKVNVCWYNMIESETVFLESLLQYDIIGISMNIGSLERFEHIYAFLLKNGTKKFPLILGGCIPTFAYEQLIEKYDNIICIYGEGEEAFLELIHCYEDGTFDNLNRLRKIGNLAFMFGNEKVITSKISLDLQREETTVRDKKILAYIREHHGIIRLEGSRGCSWNKCSFCCVNAKYANPEWRGFPIDKIVKELIEISDMGFCAPYFTDEDFFGQDYDRAIKLGEEIIELKKNGKIRSEMKFFISIMAADAICEMGKKALAVLKEAGLQEVFLGIESLEKEQLKRYHKKASIDTNKRAIAVIKDLGLYIDSGYILFDPEMSFESLGNSISYIEDLKINQLDSRSLKRLRIQPLTSIYKTLLNVVVGSLDINNLEYPYKFMDKNVNAVYEEYTRWEKNDINRTWKIQSASRGEVSDDLRKELKLLLSQIRDIDFDVLKHIYMCVERERENACETAFMEVQKQKKNQVIQKAYQLLTL